MLGYAILQLRQSLQLFKVRITSRNILIGVSVNACGNQCLIIITK